jgi:hypothetical protein
MFHFQQLLCTAREFVRAHKGLERVDRSALPVILDVELFNPLQAAGPSCRDIISALQDWVRYRLLSVIFLTVSDRVEMARLSWPRFIRATVIALGWRSGDKALWSPHNCITIYQRSEHCRVVRCRVGCVIRHSCLPLQSKLQSRSLRLPPRTAHFNTVPHDPPLGLRSL